MIKQEILNNLNVTNEDIREIIDGLYVLCSSFVSKRDLKETTYEERIEYVISNFFIDKYSENKIIEKIYITEKTDYCGFDERFLLSYVDFKYKNINKVSAMVEPFASITRIKKSFTKNLKNPFYDGKNRKYFLIDGILPNEKVFPNIRVYEVEDSILNEDKEDHNFHLVLGQDVLFDLSKTIFN